MASTIFIDNTKDNKTAKKIDEQLFELSKQIEFALINPTNILHEKKLVHADPSYDPIFEYEKKDFTEVINELESLEMHDSEIGLLLEEKRKLSLHKAKSLHHRGTPNFTKHSLNAYGRGTKTLLEDAKKLLELNSEEREKTETPEKVVNALRAELTHHGFEYFVDSTDMSASAMVQPSKKRVLVNKHRIYSKHFVKVLLVHEIGTHVLRAENGRIQPFKLFSYGLPNYMSTEEGLAVVNEEKNGLLDKRILKGYAARAIATDMALDKSFSEIYQFLSDKLSPDAAFQYALRSKRGIRDTSKSGGCTKDYAYLDGYIKVKNFLSAGGNIKDLYYGKIGLEHIDIVKKIPGIKTPQFLPRKDLFKNLSSF